MGGRQYPIWYDVQACHYKSVRSFGGKNDSSITIKVGTSSSNSHVHGIVRTTRKLEYSEEYKEEIALFRTSLDNVIMIETIIGLESKKMLKQTKNF